MEYIRKQCAPHDGKLLAIGHSMGGILLYARLSRYGKNYLVSMNCNMINIDMDGVQKCCKDSTRQTLCIYSSVGRLNVLLRVRMSWSDGP